MIFKRFLSSLDSFVAFHCKSITAGQATKVKYDQQMCGTIGTENDFSLSNFWA